MRSETKEQKGSFTHNGRCVVRYELSYPFFPERGRISPINQFGRGFCAETLRQAQTAVFKSAVARMQYERDAFAPVEIESEYQIMYDGGGVLSLFEDVFTSFGTPNRLMRREAATFDLKSGRRLRLSDLVSGGIRAEGKLMAAVGAQIAELEKKTGVLCYADWRRKVTAAIRKNRFYLSDDGISLFLPQGSIAANIWGIPTFLLKYRDIDGLKRSL